jgi:hypothetical protein
VSAVEDRDRQQVEDSELERDQTHEPDQRVEPAARRLTGDLGDPDRSRDLFDRGLAGEQTTDDPEGLDGHPMALPGRRGEGRYGSEVLDLRRWDQGNADLAAHPPHLSVYDRDLELPLAPKDGQGDLFIRSG